MQEQLPTTAWQGLLLQSFCMSSIPGGQMQAVHHGWGRYDSRDGGGRAKQEARAKSEGSQPGSTVS